MVPVADAGEDQEIQVPHDGDQETDTAEITLSCSATDLESDVVTYSWGLEGCEAADCLVLLAEGTHTFTCMVMDTYGESDSDDVEIIVEEELNEPPGANAGGDVFDQLEHDGIPGGDLEVTLAGSGSDQDTLDVLSYLWDIDGEER